MTEASHPGGHRPGQSSATGSGAALPVGRTLVVLALFVVVTVVLLGQVHPTTTVVPAAGAPATTAPPGSPSTTSTPAGNGTATTTPPGKVPVLVANGSGVTGAAGLISTRLQTAGWEVLPPVNASSNVGTSTVYYVSGHQASADGVAASLGLTSSAVRPYASSVPVSAIGTAVVVVVAGPDLAAHDSTATTAKAG